MKVEVEDISAIKKRIHVVLQPEQVAKEFDSMYRRINRSVKIKGFRPGKVPRSVLEQHYKNHVEGEVINKLIQDSYAEAIERARLAPVSQPVLENEGIEDKKGFSYSASFEVKPEFDMQGYTGNEVEKESATVTETDIRDRLEALRRSQAVLKDIGEGQAVKEGHFAVLDIEAFLEDKPFKEASAKDQVFEVVPGNFLPGFSEQLIGCARGTEKDIAIKLPQDYEVATLAGKELNFKVSVKDIRERILPELDDDFAKDLGCDSVGALRERVEEELWQRERNRVEEKLNEDLMGSIGQHNPIEIPPSMTEAEVEYMIEETEQSLAAQGLSIEKIGLSTGALRERLRERATNRVKNSLLLEAIGKKEGLTLEDAEVENEINRLGPEVMRASQDSEDPSINNNILNSLKRQLLEKKTLDFLKTKNRITYESSEA
jgi:trigger factor